MIYSTEHVFENFEGESPGCSPLIAGSTSKTRQYHLEQWFSNFHEPWRRSKDSQHLWPPAIQSKYLVLASASARGPCSASACAPREELPWLPRGGRGNRLRNPNLETRAANVWDLVQSDQYNLATPKTRQLSRLVYWHDYGQTYHNCYRPLRRFCKIDQMNYENSPQQI